MLAYCCDLPVVSAEEVAPGVRRLTVQWENEQQAPHAGQFFMLRGWGTQELPVLSRPISVHSYWPESGLLQFLYQVKGLGTQKLAALQRGDILQLTGPCGNGFDTASYTGEIAIVGGGIGTAPLYQLAWELAMQGKRADVYMGFQQAPYCMDEFAACTRRVQVATDSGEVGYHGFVTELVHPEDYDLVLCCGPEVMMRRVAAACAEAGTQCLVSMEGKMACGIGACLGCTCHGQSGAKSVCKDGPVFAASEVLCDE